MDFTEPSEHQMLRQTVRRIAASYGHRYYVECARSDRRGQELWQALADAGIIGVNVPEEYGSDEQKQRWLPAIASGEHKMAFAITEPNAGSNSHRLETTAVRDGDHYRLRGTKYYISGIDESRSVLVVTRTGEGDGLKVARCKIEVEMARLMTQKAAWLFDRGEQAGEASNMAKYAGAEAALAALDQAIQTHGGNGLASEYGLASLWGIARLLRTAPVSREMILNYVAQHSLGLPRSY